MTVKLMSLFIIGTLLLLICQSCLATTTTTKSALTDKWVLKIDHEQLPNYNDADLDKLANKLAKENNFRILRRVGSLNGYYMVELNEPRFKRSLDESVDSTQHSHAHVVRHKRETFIQKSADTLKSHHLVQSFERELLLKRTKRDFIMPPERFMHSAKLRKFVESPQLQQRPRFIDSAVINNHNFRLSNDMLSRMLVKQAASFGPLNSMSSQKRLAILTNVISKDQDPFWKDMWYLNRHMYNPDMTDMNVTSAWSQGFSGRGVSVTFLDDGLEWNHPDIKQNYDPKASTDINGNDNDPMPRYDDTNENKHGTRCAGEVAAVANNSVCGVGIAFNAGIGGIRMLDGDVTDSVEAASLSHNSQHIEIYSASWGPDDNGEVVDGPGPLARKAFVDGATKGRDGLGSIFVWASGNGGRFNDSCACDGYANSIYTISISSTTENGDKPWYLEECTSTLATTYSSGNERSGEREIITTDLHGKCTVKHTGTSAAAPLAAGIIALALEAKPDLTWRDVMYLIVLSSRPDVIKSNNYIYNRRGFKVSNRYGFGLMDAGRMVELAKEWKNVPPMQTCSTVNSKYQINSIYSTDSIETIIKTDACRETLNEVNFIEQVEVTVSIQAPIRGQLEIFLTSPMNTTSILLPKRSKDMSNEGFKRWTFMSVQLWGELPHGDWKLIVRSNVLNDIKSTVHLDDITITIYGTRTKPVDYEKLMRLGSRVPGINDPNRSGEPLNCNYECDSKSMPCGPTSSDCFKCKNYKFTGPNSRTECVSFCRIGFYADHSKMTCEKCHSSCLECNGPLATNCLSCKDGVFMKDTHECLKSCPVANGFFLNLDNECVRCAENCLSCENDKNYCLECATDLINDAQSSDQNRTFGYILKHHKCVRVELIYDQEKKNYFYEEQQEDKQCDKGTFFNLDTNKCDSCDINCADCAGAPIKDQSLNQIDNNCLTCMSDRPNLKDGGNCVLHCGETYYLNETSRRCFKCPYNCLRCEYDAESDSVSCGECLQGFLLDEKSKTCSTSYIYDKCADQNCYECFGEEKAQCRICKYDYALLNGECFLNAPTSYFKKRVQTASGILYAIQSCAINCEKCLNETVCLKCRASADEVFDLKNGKCVQRCKETEYYSEEVDTGEEELAYKQTTTSNFLNIEASNAINYCKPCRTPCEKCLNDTFCLTCETKSHSLLDGKCLISCPSGYYSTSAGSKNSKDNVCKRCNSKCSACVGPRPNDCVGCNKGYTFSNGSCISECISGSFYDETDGECDICDASLSHCKECTQQRSKCIECLLDFGLNESKNECVECCTPTDTAAEVVFTTSLELLVRNRTRNRQTSNGVCCSCQRDKLSGIVLCESNSIAHKLTRNKTVLTPNDFRVETFIYNLFHGVKLEQMNLIVDGKAMMLDPKNILSQLMEYRKMLEIFILSAVVISLTLLVTLFFVLKSKKIRKKLINGAARHRAAGDDKNCEYSLLNKSNDKKNKFSRASTAEKTSLYDNGEEEEEEEEDEEDETEFHTASTSRFNNA